MALTEDDADRAVMMMMMMMMMMVRDQSIRRVPVLLGGEVVGISLGDPAMERDPGWALGSISSAPPNA
jgi:hypothetical protein